MVICCPCMSVVCAVETFCGNCCCHCWSIDHEASTRLVNLFADWKSKGIDVKHFPVTRSNVGNLLCIILPQNATMTTTATPQQYSSTVVVPVQQQMQRGMQQPIQVGQPIQQTAAQPQTMSVIVPNGMQGGQTIQINGNGRVLSCQIPMGMLPGQSFQIQM